MRKFKIPLEKRLAALEQIKKGKSPYDIAKELKVTPQAVYRWIEISKSLSGTQKTDVVERLARLERDIDSMKTDLTLLKTMLARRIK